MPPHASSPTHMPTPSTHTSQKPTHTITELRQNSNLWYKLNVFIYDLRHFRSSEPSRSRLDSLSSLSYIGAPYFSATEADTILHTASDVEGAKTLQQLLDEFFEQKLEKRLKSRMEETADYRVCAAHDLAPILERAFRIHPKDLAKNKGFLRLVGAGLGALDGGGVWKGLGKR